MVKRKSSSTWARTMARSFAALTRTSLNAGSRAVGQAVRQAARARRPPGGAGDWLTGVAVGPSGVRRYRLFRPHGVSPLEQLPLMVMLHGCGQDANGFAQSTRMNGVAARARFLVLYPEQDRLANTQGCWNWYDTDSGRAQGEAALVMAAIDQVCLLYPVDRARVAIAGLSAGASMAALLVTRQPERFQAVVMHSGVAPGSAHSTLTALGAMRGRRSAAPLAAGALAIATAFPPVLVIQGDSDRIVASANGRAAAQVWADAAGAQAGPARSVQRGQRYAMTVTDFKRSTRLVATLVDVARLGHAWSGGAAKLPFSDPQGPDASRMAWAFASKQFRATASAPVRARAAA